MCWSVIQSMHTEKLYQLSQKSASRASKARCREPLRRKRSPCYERPRVGSVGSGVVDVFRAAFVLHRSHTAAPMKYTPSRKTGTGHHSAIQSMSKRS